MLELVGTYQVIHINCYLAYIFLKSFNFCSLDNQETVQSARKSTTLKCSLNRTAWYNHFVCSKVLTCLAVITCCQGDRVCHIVHLSLALSLSSVSFLTSLACVCGEGRWTVTSCRLCSSGPWCGWWWLSTCSSASTCSAHCAAGATGGRSQTWKVQRSRGLRWWTSYDITHL